MGEKRSERVVPETAPHHGQCQDRQDDVHHHALGFAPAGVEDGGEDHGGSQAGGGQRYEHRNDAGDGGENQTESSKNFCTSGESGRAIRYVVKPTHPFRLGGRDLSATLHQLDRACHQEDAGEDGLENPEKDIHFE